MKAAVTTRKYTHFELNKEIEALAGYYTPLQEVRLKYDNREILYIINQVVIEASCCSTANYGQVLVPGYIINWQQEKNADGLLISEVEPISNKDTQNRVRDIIKKTENISQIEFW